MLNQFTMAEAKRDLSIGYMTKFSIQKAVMGDGWEVHLIAGTNNGPLVDARSRTARQFKTLDAAIKAVEEIGFKVEYLS